MLFTTPQDRKFDRREIGRIARRAKTTFRRAAHAFTKKARSDSGPSIMVAFEDSRSTYFFLTFVFSVGSFASFQAFHPPSRAAVFLIP